MALARVKVWIAGEVLTASDLNTEFNNILNNSNSLFSPWSANVDAGGFRLITLSAGTVGSPTLQPTGDTNTGVYFPAADQVSLAAGSVQVLQASAYASAVNFLRVVPSQSQQPVQVEATGADTNVALSLVPKGTGYVTFPVGDTGIPGISFGTDQDTGIYLAGNNLLGFTARGALALRVDGIAGAAVNFVAITPAATGNLARVIGTGTDPNPGLSLEAAGATGQVIIGSTNTAFVPAAVSGTPATHALFRENVPKVWVNFDGTTGATNDSFNISSVSDDGTGLHTVTFARAFTNALYAAVATCTQPYQAAIVRIGTGSVQVGTYDNTASFVDIATVYLVCLGKH